MEGDSEDEGKEGAEEVLESICADEGDADTEIKT